MAAGDTVRFVAAPPGTLESFDDVWTPAPSATAPPPRSGRSLTIVQPGLLTTVQDAGRWGHQHAGVPVSGALDLASLAAANRCVGNAPGTAAIEATLPGLEVRADVALRIGLAGADLGAELDGRAVSATGALACGAGQVLRFTRRGSGARAYVAIAGGVDSVPVLGSRATDLSSGLGGLAGARLRAGDVVPVGPPHGTGEMASRAEPAPQALPRVPRGGARVRVMPGPHGEWFPPEALTALARERFAITPDSNRMGYRLRAGAPLPRRPGELISDATCAGALQVTPSGEPILLMADRQVTGGYPIIATVITADLGIAGQLAPGDWIEFEPCTRADALRALAALRAGA
jgi:antagonist of KipI